jgi:hypothetical protein
VHRISRKPQVNQGPRVKTVSFQAHAFSDGDSIHLKLVSISSDANNRAAILICMPHSPVFSNRTRLYGFIPADELSDRTKLAGGRRSCVQFDRTVEIDDPLSDGRERSPTPMAAALFQP